MSISRRLFLKTSLLAGSFTALSASMLARVAFAAWPEAAFEAAEYPAALKEIIGDEIPTESDVVIEANDIAENGATVPVQVSTELANVESITIFVEKNPRPWISNYRFHGKSKAFVSTRLKMRETSNVVAIAKADGKLFMSKKTIKVTAGGCG